MFPTDKSAPPEGPGGEDFLADLRHELRTPLNAILGYSELILEDAAAPLRRRIGDDLLTVIEVARRLLGIIDVQVRAHLIEAGTTSLQELRSRMQIALGQLSAATGSVRRALETGEDDSVRADAERLVTATKLLSELVDRGLSSASIAAGRMAPAGADAQALEKSAAGPEAAGGHILVADDNPVNVDLLTRRLTQQGHRVTSAANGRIALDLLHAEPFDLLLLDIMMPEMSGFEVLRVLRAEDRLHDLPVIMISALDDVDSVVQCLKLGAVDHLPKPFNPVILNARIGASLSIKRLRDKANAFLEQIESELKTARELQLMMVPRNFAAADHPGSISICGSLEPARRIGGDLYDFFYGEDGHLYFLIGDVCGKGIPAALYMTRTKTLFRLVAEEAGRGETSPDAAAILSRINHELARDNPSLIYVTAVMGRLDPATGAFDLANAGHPMPLLVDAASGVSTFETSNGLPLGLVDDKAYKTHSASLSAGTTIFLYTDGVTDTLNLKDEQFGDDRLFAALAGAAPRPAALIADLGARLAEFAGATEPFDDITMLAIAYRAPEKSAPAGETEPG